MKRLLIAILIVSALVSACINERYPEPVTAMSDMPAKALTEHKAEVALVAAVDRVAKEAARKAREAKETSEAYSAEAK